MLRTQQTIVTFAWGDTGSTIGELCLSDVQAISPLNGFQSASRITTERLVDGNVIRRNLIVPIAPEWMQRLYQGLTETTNHDVNKPHVLVFISYGEIGKNENTLNLSVADRNIWANEGFVSQSQLAKISGAADCRQGSNIEQITALLRSQLAEFMEASRPPQANLGDNVTVLFPDRSPGG